MMYFEKYQATGNDFILFKTEVNDVKSLAIKVSDRHFGIGADGILFPSKSDVADIKMNYYNSDGSIAKMCGNGIRAFAKFVFDHQLVTQTHFFVETLAGIKEVTLLDNDVLVDIGPANLEVSREFLNKDVHGLKPYAFDKVDGYILTMGTLHAVVYVDDYENLDLNHIAPIIQNDSIFKNQTNVNFVKILNQEHIFVKTYERGAGWTLSCGTGVSASAYHAYLMKKITHNKILVDVPGGKLMVIVENDKIYLKGPAIKVAQGEII